MDNNLEAILESLRPLLSRVRTDVTALKRPGKGQIWTNEPLTDERMLEHLNGVQKLRGVSPIKEGESTIQVAVIDMDSHKGEVPWDEMLTHAQTLRDALLAKGLKPHLFRSSGGNGIHQIMIWDEPQDASAVRKALRYIADCAGYADFAGGKGIVDHQIEIFPKQDAVPMGGKGNQFILPLGAQSRYIDPAQGLIEDNGLAAQMIVWEVSTPIATAKAQGDEDEDDLFVIGTQPERVDDLEQAVANQPLEMSAQDVIDYFKSYPASETDYDGWMRAGAALHHQFQGSDEGLKIFDAWSRKDTERYDKKVVAQKWKSYGKYTGQPVTMASVIKAVGGASKVKVLLDDGAVVTKFDALKAEAQGVTDLESYQVFAKKIAAMNRSELGDDLRPQLAKVLHTVWGKAQGLSNTDIRKALAHKAVSKTTRSGRPKYDLDEEGRIKPNSYNHELMVATVSECGIEIGYDTFQDCIMFKRTPEDGWQRFLDQHYHELLVRAEVIGFSYSDKSRLRDAVYAVAVRSQFDSAQTWIRGLTWDGVHRVDDFCAKYFNVEPSPYATAVSRYMWSALAGRVIVPGIQADMTPVLVGSQGLRKTSGIKAISPAPEFFSELSFGEKEEELARKMRGTLVCEIAELRGLRSREKEHIKAWMTRTHEKHTPKYKEFATAFPRRCVLFGSTNDFHFLDEDSSGQRRWLPLTVGAIDVEAIIRDRDQLWAESVFIFDQHQIEHREAEILAVDHHADYVEQDPFEDSIVAWLDSYESLDGEKKSLQSIEVVQGALGLPVNQINRVHFSRLSTVMKKHGWRQTMRRIEGRRTKVWTKDAN